MGSNSRRSRHASPPHHRRLDRRSPAPRRPRGRRLPPGFSRKSRESSPSCSMVHPDRSRVPHRASETGSRQVPSVRLPPHLQNEAQRRGSKKVVDEQPQTKIPKNLDSDYINGVQLPNCNPFLLPLLSASSPNHHRQDSPGRLQYFQGYGAKDHSPHHHLYDEDDRRGMGPAHGPQRSHLRYGTDLRHNSRRRSATPVLDITAISQRSESLNSGQLEPNNSIHDHQSTRPKKKHKRQESTVASQWTKVPDRVVGNQKEDQRLSKSHEVQYPGQKSIVNPENGGLQTSIQPMSQDAKNPPVAEAMQLMRSTIVPCDHYIAELRLLLAERMHQALESAIGKAQGDCGILEESIEVDYQGRFGKTLNFVEAGFPTLKDMIRSTCLDIVQMQQLKAGEVVKIGFIPTAAFKLEAGKVLAGVRDVYAKLVLENRIRSRSRDQGNSACQPDQKPDELKPTPSTVQPQKTPFMLAKMARNMLRSIMRDIVSGVWPSVTISQFLEKFFSHYSVRLEAKDLGFGSIQDFLSHVDNSVRFQDINGITHLFPSEKYLNEKPPVLAGLHGKKNLTVPSTLLERNPAVVLHTYAPETGVVAGTVESCIASASCEHEAPGSQNNSLKLGGNAVISSGHQNTGCQLLDATPIGTENTEKCAQHSSDVVTNNWKVSSGICQAEEIQGAGNGHTANNSNPHRAPEQTAPSGVLLNSADAQDVYRMLEQAVDAGIRKRLKIQEAEVLNHTIDANGLGQTSLGTGGSFIGLAQNVPLEVPFTSTGCGALEVPSTRALKVCPNGVSPCLNPPQMSGYCDSGLAHLSAALEMGRVREESKPPLSDVLSKVTEVLRKAMMVNPAPVHLNRLPLLYFNEFHHVLDFIGLGFGSLPELVNLLDDFILVADGPDGKMIVPRGMQATSMPVISQILYQMPQSLPLEMQLRGDSSPLMTCNQVQKLRPFQSHMVLNAEGQVYNASNQSSHTLGASSTHISGSHDTETCILQQKQVLPLSAAHNGYIVQGAYSQVDVSSVANSHPQYRDNGNRPDVLAFGADRSNCNPLSLDLHSKTADIWDSWPGYGNQQKKVHMSEAKASVQFLAGSEKDLN